MTVTTKKMPPCMVVIISNAPKLNDAKESIKSAFESRGFDVSKAVDSFALDRGEGLDKGLDRGEMYFLLDFSQDLISKLAIENDLSIKATSSYTVFVYFKSVFKPMPTWS